MRRRRARFAAMACVLVAALIAWEFWPRDFFFPRLTVAANAPTADISVGENIQVSKQQANTPFTECVIAADPEKPNRLFAASMYWPQSQGTSLIGYLSEDGGATWKTSLELPADRTHKSERLADPTAGFGPDGELYLVHMRTDDAEERAMGPNLGKEGAGSLDWLCLPAGATDWQLRGRIDRHIDRPWLAVDLTKGPNRGRLYCTSNVGPPQLITSSDGGRTFHLPEVPHSKTVTAYPAQPVVLSDGSVVAAYKCSRNMSNTADHTDMPTFISLNGGQSVQTGADAGHWKHPHLTPSQQTTQGFFPQLAADPGSAHFADHLYLVWAQRFDNRRTTEWILFSRSTDHGKTWSAPVSLSEQPEDANPTTDYIAYIPCVAVNKAGVIAVTWYDRRGLPGNGYPNLKGWNVRLRVSTDGGVNWHPSVQINSQPCTGNLTGWHTAGLCADAAGRFHPAWIDDRTGVAQLWTATIVAAARPISPATEASR